jgi:hypothetical protein
MVIRDIGAQVLVVEAESRELLPLATDRVVNITG